MPTANYYFVKVSRDLLTSPEVKGLRARPRGDTLLVVLLELALLAQDTGGLLTYTGIEPTAAREWACQLGESVEDVEATILYALRIGWAEPVAETPEEIRLSLWEALVGTETYAAIRQRRHRQALAGSSADAPEAPAVEAVLPAAEAKKKREKRVYSPDSSPYKAAKYLAREIAENDLKNAQALGGGQGKTYKDYIVSEDRIQSWADDVRKINEIDGRSWEEIQAVVIWTLEDAFESGVVRSGRKLRERFGVLAAKAAKAERGVE